MRLVIEISEQTYKAINAGYFAGKELYNAVKNGTPLPKGHGRLIDADFTVKQYEEYCRNNCKYSEKQRDCMCRACPTGDAIEMIEDAPTVLEASELFIKDTREEDQDKIIEDDINFMIGYLKEYGSGMTAKEAMDFGEAFAEWFRKWLGGIDDE